jgi:predicted RecB family nuclease
MPGKITEQVLEAYLKCKYKAHLKLAGQEGSPTEYGQMCRQRREAIRGPATSALIGRYGVGQVVPNGLSLTADVLKGGTPLLLDAAFEDEHFSVRFDGLLRVSGSSQLGDFHYQPVLFHEVERTSRDVRALLGLYGALLGPLQGKQPVVGVLIHGQACLVKRLSLKCGAGQARRILREVREARGGPLPRLVLNSHCQACEFSRRCQNEAAARDELSLLRGISESEIGKYAKRGIITVSQLANTFRPPRRCKKNRQRKVKHSHALQALAVREKKVYVLGNPELPSSPSRIYFDMEGDPERGFCYLVGALVIEGEREERHCFWADTPEDEPRLLEQVLAVAARRPDAWLYAYGSYEAAFLRRLAKATGRSEEVENVLARTLNVLSVIYAHVYLPVESNGLKDVARYLGFSWSDPGASGLQSIVWRRRWQETRAEDLKEKLTTYNLEDCQALRRVAEFLHAACPRPTTPQAERGVEHDGPPVSRVEEAPRFSRGEWCVATFALPDFGFVNKRAYFDYQRDRVYARSSKAIKRSKARGRRKGKKRTRPDRTVELTEPQCRLCGSTDLSREADGRLARLTFDLRFRAGGVRRLVSRYTTTWHWCRGCDKRFLPSDYLNLDEHGHRLKSWAVYKHIAHRATLASIAEEVRDCFRMPIVTSDVVKFKMMLASYYEGTYKRLLERIVGGGLLHADETEVTLKGLGKGYVWVFTNLEEVYFLYRDCREGGFLQDLLKDFRGVLVSDFYAGYDALACAQQKCLIHLMRDFNDDLKGNPWDEELKSIAGTFGKLLREVVATVDRHGLKCKSLAKHERDVKRFFESVGSAEYRSDVAEGYRKRLLKCRDKLFTFMKYDGIPWNNNNAEHAIKRLAYYRKLADGQWNETGLKAYLVLLSVCLTCEYKGVGFLQFLLSRRTDIDDFCEQRGRPAPAPTVDLLPEGFSRSWRKLSPDWDLKERPRFD